MAVAASEPVQVRPLLPPSHVFRLLSSSLFSNKNDPLEQREVSYMYSHMIA